MTQTYDGDGSQPVVKDAPRPELPLVSVVVVNYNYGRYLDDAVGSVFAQTYANVECIVVDNASTDESAEILVGLRSRHPALIVIQRASNDGQTPASLEGLAAASGAYVIFLDADDYLLPPCVETHIFVHLSLRDRVAFTSSDMLQVAGKNVVVATGEDMNRFLRRWRPGGRLGRRRYEIRPYTATPHFPSAAVAGDIADKVHYVRPLKVRWVWSPTSGLLYRRDALMLFADNAKLATLRTGTDLYFAYGCSGLSGSVIIDEPLFAYRIHGGNIFTARPQLDRTLNFTPGGHGDSNIRAQLYLVDHLVARAERFAPNLILKLNLIALLQLVDRRDVDVDLPGWARRSRAAQAIVHEYPAFSRGVGAFLARVALIAASGSLRSPTSLAKGLPPDKPKSSTT